MISNFRQITFILFQGTASEATLVALLAARSRMVQKMKEKDPSIEESSILAKLVAYTSDQAHSSVERACLLGSVKCHMIKSDEKEQMRGDSLAKAITEDREKGLIPFYVSISSNIVKVNE